MKESWAKICSVRPAACTFNIAPPPLPLRNTELLPIFCLFLSLSLFSRRKKAPSQRARIMSGLFRSAICRGGVDL
jgi:hypothetical protein